MNQHETFYTDIEDDIDELMLKNAYIQKCVSNKKKDESSLSYLIDIELSQSEMIKLGIGFEGLLRDFVLHKNSCVTNIKPKNIKGKKEFDHLFCDEEKKIIYYAELKGNLNLDTEKSKKTYDKCKELVEKCKEMYPDYEIRWCLLGFRYINYDDIPKTIKKRYDDIKENVFGINEYLHMLSINFSFNETTYRSFLNKLAKQMFKKQSLEED